MWDVAIVGSGPAGASCAIGCARAGLRTLVIERALFPREKVCGDCLNPTCWPVLERLGVAVEVRAAPHAMLSTVEFIGVDGRSTAIALPEGETTEIAIKRSLLDHILQQRARSLGAEVRENATLLFVRQENDAWHLELSGPEAVAKILVAADGRNSTVARLCHLMPREARERVGLQTHLPLPPGAERRVVMQLLREGYSGRSDVGDGWLNLCLVSKPNDLPAIRKWAEEKFQIAPNYSWRTIAPLARAPIFAQRPNLFFVGDAARVVEPFTGEGIYYALRSGELAAEAIVARDHARYSIAHEELYAGRLWINRLSRQAVCYPRLTTALLRFFPDEKRLLRFLTAKVTAS